MDTRTDTLYSPNSHTNVQVQTAEIDTERHVGYLHADSFNDGTDEEDDAAFSLIRSLLQARARTDKDTIARSRAPHLRALENNR